MKNSSGPGETSSASLLSFAFGVILLFTVSKECTGHFQEMEVIRHEGKSDARYVNVTVLLPFDPYYQASLVRVGPGILLGFEAVRDRGLLPNHNFRLTYHDSQCSNVFAPMKAIESVVSKSVHVFFGPSCDLALGKYIHILSTMNFYENPVKSIIATRNYSKVLTFL
jgi:hypothetical protein